MFCRECGREVLQDSKFCDNCGVKVVVGDETTSGEWVVMP